MATCPCCSDTLLRSIAHKKIIWFCPSCRQEMPNMSIVEQPEINQEALEIIHVNQENLSEIFSSTQIDLQPQNILVAELPLLKSFIIKGKLRLYIAELIIYHLSKLVVNAISDELYLENQIKNKQHKVTCLYDGKLILHCIIYSFLIGDAAIIEHNCLKKLKQTYNSFGNPFDNIANFLEILKNKTILLVNQIASEDLESSFETYYSAYASLTSELASYFDTTLGFLDNS
ncbi:MAG: hypothetical protein AAGA80_08845 [Cyanobacteria bacterium P01_F01_bin.143]